MIRGDPGREDPGDPGQHTTTPETFPSQRTITMTPDSANRPNTLAGAMPSQPSTNYVTGIQYSPSSGISSLARGNGLTNSLAYNSRLQPTSIQEKRSSDNSVLFNLAPNWVNPSNQNNNGTLWNLSTTANGLSYTQTFGYDALNRLTSASEGSAWSQSYNYDQYGNMWMPTTTNGLPAPAIGPVAPTTNAYAAPNVPVTNRNLNSTYDAAGNLTLFGSTTITYDANNMQTAAGSNTYAYDGLGQRVSRTVGSAPTTYYVYDVFGQLSAEYSAAPVTTPPCVTCYLTYDHLGSPRMVTDPGAQIVALHDYAPFGQEIPAGVDGRTSLWGTSDNVNQKFTGQERDSETNLDFFQARYMSSGLGRFMSPDPYNAGADATNPQSWNGYAYVGGNPLNSTDPSGTCAGINTGITTSPTGPGGYALLQDAALYHFDIGFGYAGGTHVGDIGRVAVQGLLGASLTPTNVAGAMSADVQAQSTSSNSNSAIIGWSGGTAAAQNAGIPDGAAQLNFSPGGAWAPLNGPSSQTFSGSGLKDLLVNLTSPGTINRPGSPGCGHDAACMWGKHNAQINTFLNNNNVQPCPHPTVFLPPSYKVPPSGVIKPTSGGGSYSGGAPTIVFQNCKVIEYEGSMVQSCSISVL